MYVSDDIGLIHNVFLSYCLKPDFVVDVAVHASLVGCMQEKRHCVATSLIDGEV